MYYCLFASMNIDEIIKFIDSLDKNEINVIQDILNLRKNLSDDGTDLRIGHDLNLEIIPEYIPKSVTHLTFGYYFNQKLKPGLIPESVTHLTFGYYFNQKLVAGVPGTIPESVTHLIFGQRFNQKIEPGTIPKSVTHLYLGTEFNQLKENITVFNTIEQINIVDNVYYYGTEKFSNRFTVYQKMVKGAI